jgi:hypothetical protein
VSKQLTIIQLMEHCLQPWFKDAKSWAPWKVVLKLIFGLRITSPAELALLKHCTGLDAPPAERISEIWLGVGRRGGKSQILALIAVYLAIFCDWSSEIVPGEYAVIRIMAADQSQAHAIYGYARAKLRHLAAMPMFADKFQIMRDTNGELELSNGITIEISTASFRSVRGATIIAALCDEIAFWFSDGANPDKEIIRALRPGMATIKRSLLLCASNPYAKRGELWATHEKCFGKSGRILFWKADTKTMRPTFPQRIIDEAFQEDDVSAASEYGRGGVIVFRSDLESYVSKEIVDAAVVSDRVLLPPAPGINYVAFTDPAGGSGGDSFTLAIAHRDENGVGILDRVIEIRPPFSPDTATEQHSNAIKEYNQRTVTGDKYAGDWPKDRFAAHGIDYLPSERTKSEIYLAFMPLLNSYRVELLNDKRMVEQLLRLERSTGRGRDVVDHPKGLHDDIINAAAGALVLASGEEDAVALMARLGRM